MLISINGARNVGDFPFLTLLDHVKGMTYPVLLRVLLLGFIRMAPIVSLAPFLGAKLIPGAARVALAISLATLMLPIMLFNMHSLNMTDPQFVGFAIKEIVIGYILGFFSTVPFFIAQSSGIVIDYMRGSSMLMAQDPSTQTQSSSIGIMLNYYLIVLFFSIDGPFYFFDILQTSFEVFPVDSYINPGFFNLNVPLWKTSIGLLGKIFALSLQLAAPAILAILMAEVFLGIANRLAPQVQIAFLGMSLKSLLGLTLLWAGWRFMLSQTADVTMNWLRELYHLTVQFPLFNTPPA